MVKIRLADYMKDKHREYFRQCIVPAIQKIRQSSFSLDSEVLEKAAAAISITESAAIVKFDKQRYQFYGYILNRYQRFAIGDFDELKLLHQKIVTLFPMLSIIMTIEQNPSKYGINKDRIKKFNQEVNQVFGFNNFTTRPMFYYIKKYALKQQNLHRKKKLKKCNDHTKTIVMDIIQQQYGRKALADVKKELGPRNDWNHIQKAFEKCVRVEITYVNWSEQKILEAFWSDYIFVMALGLRVCPYCNRHYITPYLSENGRVRADLDHFLPKSIYPYFSMSLYNLVPVCMPCNRSLKRDIDFDFNYLNPYMMNLDDVFRFKANVSTDLFLQLEVTGGSEGGRLHLEALKLEPLYNYHKNIAEDMYKLGMAYNKESIKNFYEANKAFFSTEEAVVEALFGVIGDRSRLNDEAFLKLKRDIGKQLGIIEEEEDTALIEELERLMAIT